MASNTLFVSNFPFTTTEDDLRNAFEVHGSVKSVRIIVDRETGRSRGFAFIELIEGSAGDSAIAALNNCDFRGRRLVVSQARGRSAPGGGGVESGAARPAPSAASAPRAPVAPPLRHRITIEWDDGSGTYTASIPSLGVQTQAPTIEAVARQAESLGQERAAFPPDEPADLGSESDSSVREA